MILITGHRGMMGSRLIKKVRAVGIDVRDGMNLLTCELPDGIDTIYHLAAQTSVENSWKDPVHDAQNLAMTARLAKRYPLAKIIYTSSAATLEPISSPYGFSKWASGEYLKRFHPHTVICVLPNVYGEPGGKSVVDIFKENEQVVIYGTGDQKRDYVHVDDIVEGLVAAAEWPPGEYQLGSGKATSVLELAEGKIVTFRPARKEAHVSVLRNTTPNWRPRQDVLEYLNEN